MRSTGFLILSILVHVLAVAAIALGPQRLSEFAQGTQVEVKLGEPAAMPGIAEAEQPAEPPAAAEAQPAPAPAPKPAPAVKKVVEKVAAAPKTAKARPVKSAPAKAAVAAKSPSQDLPEKLDPAVDEAGVTVPSATPAPTAADNKAEEKVELIPVKETAPAGVEAASDREAGSDQDTEASSEDVKKAADPAPVGVTEEAPASASPANANAGASNGTGEQLGKGGATQAGAVEYTDLKQINGNKPPVYPMAARMEKRQGQVELLYRVTKDGHVADVSVAQSSGSADLDKEAVRAVSQYRFIPGQEGWAKHPVVFSLKGETAALPSRLRNKVGAQ